MAGRYRLLRPIGAGGMGAVWAARHELLGRDLALKMCAPTERPDRASREARTLFLREVRIVGKLRHPNVVDIADAGDAGRDGLYLAMELLEGESLAARIAAGPLSPHAALAIAAELCRGLAAAHTAGVVHRDLKPENVFLARGPGGGVVPKLLDFGVSSARGLTTLNVGKLFGTPAYMSPEQALGEPVIDLRCDVWAMGVVLYEMLTGRLPFHAESYPALLPLIIDAPYPPLPADLPAEARTVVAGCLAKDRSDRYPTADALREAIERALAAVPVPEPESTRSGFFVETGRSAGALGVTVGRPSAATAGVEGAARTARFGLATAILAVPLAVGIAALATGSGNPGASTRRAPAAGMAGPAASGGVAPALAPVLPTAAATATASAGTGEATPAGSAAPPFASASASASTSASAHPAAPRPHRAPGVPWPKVTRVDNAGF